MPRTDHRHLARYARLLPVSVITVLVAAIYHDMAADLAPELLPNQIAIAGIPNDGVAWKAIRRLVALGRATDPVALLDALPGEGGWLGGWLGELAAHPLLPGEDALPVLRVRTSAIRRLAWDRGVTRG